MIPPTVFAADAVRNSRSFFLAEKNNFCRLLVISNYVELIIEMMASKSQKIVVCARPPKTLSAKALQTLRNTRPSKETRDRIDSMVKLKIVDGSTCGF